MNDEINLLPDQFQSRRLRVLYLLRLGRLLNRIYIPLLLLVVGQVAVYYSLLMIKNNMVELTALSAQGTSEVVSEVSEINSLLRQLTSKIDQVPMWSDRVEGILGLVPGSVNLLSLAVEEQDQSLTLRGVSSSRAAVIGLREELESLPWVKHLEAPLANFALSPDAEFSFVLYGKEPI